MILVKPVSYSAKKYPPALNMAKVLALYKKNEMYLPDNYRPISLLSCFDKIFEKIIYRRLIFLLKT